MQCKICGNSNIKDHYVIKEMMFGLDESFRYFLCNECQCLQIEEVPAAMEKYYDHNYYSFRPDHSLLKKMATKMAVLRDKSELYKESITGKIISWFTSSREEVRFVAYLKEINKHSKILDIGSGIGFHLKRLSDLGFTNLRGIDPFLKEEVHTYRNVTIFRKFLNEFDENNFDLITLHHVFEHLPDPRQTLSLIFDKLVEEGYCVIRTPVFPNEAWELYKENWFQLDAPRHFFIHSTQSIRFLCRLTGFHLYGVIYDSTPMQYYISEQYQKGIPLTKQLPIRKKEAASYSKKVAIANKLGRGDQAIFILKKAKTNQE